ncbi:cellular retinoic acid-binding protein 1-like [Tubulanus polymorphus]|uniref:cellular retinoic acid-binding protein 1-like n=1 Tax=Tubulanus polymorphus TaxID=672921 RepID=UPI003DA5796D
MTETKVIRRGRIYSFVPVILDLENLLPQSLHSEHIPAYTPEHTVNMAQSVNFTGTWKLEKSENLDKFFAFLKEDAGLLQKMGMEIAKGNKPTQKIEQNGDHFDIELHLPVKKNLKFSFNVGEEYTFESPDGRKFKGTPVWEPEGTLRTEMQPVSDKAFHHFETRAMDGDMMMWNVEIPGKDFIVKRWFVKQ